MAVSVVITDRKVFNQYANGDNYNSNLTTFTSYLRGGVMNAQRIEYTVDIGWGEAWDSTSGNRWTVDGNRLSRNQGSFIDEGFSIGDKIDLLFGAPLVAVFTDRIITNITDTLIFFDGAAITPVTEEDAGLIDGGKTDLFGLEYSFGIINNNDPAFYTSLLDNSDQTFYAGDIGLDSGGGRSTAFVDMQPKSNYNLGWNTSHNSNTVVKFDSRPTANTQRFVIRHEYIINPYNDESLLDENNSFKYVSKFDFRTTLANVNTSKVAEDDLQLGSVGYFNENYDGYNNDFTISDLVYTDVATVSQVQELNISEATKVEFNVNSASGLFTSNDPFVIFHSYLPDFNNYNKSPESFRDTWIYESEQNLIDAGISGGATLQSVEATFVNANQIAVSFEVNFTSQQKNKLDEGFNYVLAVEVGNGLAQNDNVTLLIDSNQYTKEANITDLIISDSFGFNPYYKFIAPTIDLFTTYKGWVEDEIVSYHRFGVNRTAAKDGEILGAKFRLVAYEDATGQTFDLQSENLDLSNQLLAPPNTVNSNPFTIQLIEDNRTRGYRLPNGDEFNLLLFETKDNDSTYQFYEWRVGFKMNWQNWIALPGADSVFIDTSKPFNGLNNNASNYSLKNGWSIRTIWDFDMSGLDDNALEGETNYNFITQEHDIFNFDEQDGESDGNPLIWDCEIFTFDSEGNNLGGAILSDEETFIKAIFTPQAPYIISDILPYWAELRIAEENQNGFNNDVLSTTKSYLDNNRLIPLEGESFAKISLVSNTIEVEAKTNLSAIKENVNYKLSSRLANQDEPIEPITWTFSTKIDILNPTNGNFDPVVTAIGGEAVTWELIEGTTYPSTNILNIPNGATLEGTELNGVCQNVTVTFSTNDATNITGIDAENDYLCSNLDLSLFTNCENFNFDNNNIASVTNPTSSKVIINYDVKNSDLSTLDLSTFSNLGGLIDYSGNPNLTTVTNPTSPILITTYLADNCNLSSLDVSTLNLSGDFRAHSNTSLSSITLATTTNNNAFTVFHVFSCPSLTTIDISNYTAIGGQIQLDNNSLTTLTTGSSSQNITKFYAYNNSLTSLDLSGYTGIGNDIRIFGNSGLTTVTMPTLTTGELKIFNAKDCNLGYIDLTVFTTYNTAPSLNFSGNAMSVADVSQMLIDLDSKLIATATGSPTINFTGGTNATPNAAGLTAKANLNARGYNVTTN